MTRNDILLDMFDPSGNGLEIGASYNPLLPKNVFPRVEILDYATEDELREKYKNTQNVDVSRIEQVDYVSDGKPFFELIGKPKFYDFIVASHVIEHTPDLIGFLDDCSALLRDSGSLVLAIPDKRNCFDVFQSLTSTGQLLQAHSEKRSRVSPATVFDSIAYDGLRGGSIGWLPQDVSPLRFANGIESASSLYSVASASENYLDVHAWHFVPSSFRLIVKDLHSIGAIDLKEALFHDSIGNEFFIALSRAGEGCAVDRLTLAKQILKEHAQIIVS